MNNIEPDDLPEEPTHRVTLYCLRGEHRFSITFDCTKERLEEITSVQSDNIAIRGQVGDSLHVVWSKDIFLIEAVPL